MIEDPSLIYDAQHATAHPEVSFAVRDVFIGWNIDEAGRITDVLVTDRRENLTPFRGTSGAVFSRWMEPNGANSPAILTPEGVFGLMLAWGFASPYAMRRAIKMFARIKECVWARRILYSLDCELPEHALTGAAAD